MIGNGIKKLREIRGLSQGDLCVLIETDQSYVSQIEQNAKIPSSKLVKKIAEALDVHPIVLYWFNLTRDDVREEKRGVFDTLKHSIDQTLTEIFIEK